MLAVSTDREYFEKLYETSVDPFHIWQSEFEASKRAQALKLLQKPYYNSIFEPGCGNGAFSLDLAQRCAHLTAVDWSSDALLAASLHCAGLPNVEFCEMDFPSLIPQRKYDLMLVSELLYYFSEVRLKKFFDTIPELVLTGGEVMLIHSRGVGHDHPSVGDAVHEAFHGLSSVCLLQTFEHPQYLISSALVL